MGFRLRKGDEIVETPSVGMRDFLLTKQYEDISDSSPEVVLFQVNNAMGDDAGNWKEPATETVIDSIRTDGLVPFIKGRKGK